MIVFLKKIYGKLIIFKYFLDNIAFSLLPKISKKIFFYNQNFFYPFFGINYNKSYFDSKIQEYFWTFKIIDKHLINLKKINHFLDVGANLGYYSIYVKNELPNSNFYCFEPHPISYYYLNKNLGNYKNINLFNFALGQYETFEDIAMPIKAKNKRKSNLGLMKIGGKSNFLKYKIAIKNFDNLNLFTDNNDIYFMKIDVEGFEIEVLKGMQKFLKKIKNFYGCCEINPEYQSIKNIIELFDVLKSFDFKDFYYLYDKGSNKKIIKINEDYIEKNFEYLNVFDLYFSK